MKLKEKWAEGCLEGLRMEFCRPPNEKEIWLSGFEYAKMKLQKVYDTYLGSDFDEISQRDFEDLGEIEI